jgi:hypothetical protein
VAEFLSREWLADLDAVARGSAALRTATAEIAATLEQVVPDAPGGAVRYHVRIDHGDVRVHPGPAAAADVTFLADYEVARAINDGSATAQQALAAGRLKIKGDLPRLAGEEMALVAVGDIFAMVRASTTYADWPT